MLYENKATDVLDARPTCDVCMSKVDVPARRAIADGKTTMGPWAYMCEDHFTALGTGLGLGVGQIILCGDELDHRLIPKYLTD